MYDGKRTKSRFREEVERKARAPCTAFLPPFAAMDLWRYAKARDLHPQELLSELALHALYPDKTDRRRKIRRWRREVAA